MKLLLLTLTLLSCVQPVVAQEVLPVAELECEHQHLILFNDGSVYDESSTLLSNASSVGAEYLDWNNEFSTEDEDVYVINGRVPHADSTERVYYLNASLVIRVSRNSPFDIVSAIELVAGFDFSSRRRLNSDAEYSCRLDR